MKRYLLVLAAVAAAVTALAGSAGAITGNYTKDFVHDNVGLLVFYTPDTPPGGACRRDRAGRRRCPTAMGVGTGGRA